MEWKEISGFEGYYVSDEGDVYSSKSDRILKQEIRKDGYCQVDLWANGKGNKQRVHRLVATAFIPNESGLTEVNHIDGNKQNNVVSNLEWCSQKYNVRESMRLHPEQNEPIKKYNASRTIPVAQYTKSGEFIRMFKSAEEAANELGICERNIRQVASGTAHRKTAGGFVWKNRG